MSKIRVKTMVVCPYCMSDNVSKINNELFNLQMHFKCRDCDCKFDNSEVLFKERLFEEVGEMAELAMMKIIDNKLINHCFKKGEEIVVLQDGYNGYDEVKICWKASNKRIQLVHEDCLEFIKWFDWEVV